MDANIEATVNEADVIVGTVTKVTLTTGDTVIIRKCKVKQIGEVLRFLSFLMGKVGMKTLDDKPNMDLENPVELMMLVADGSEKIYPVVSSLCSLSLEEFEDLDIEDAMAIATAEWTLNRDFFLKKILPMLGKQQAKSRTSKASVKKKSTRKRKVSS